MKKVGVAILGLGVVGGGTYKILTEHSQFYKKNHGLEIVVESVLERNKERVAEIVHIDNKRRRTAHSSPFTASLTAK